MSRVAEALRERSRPVSHERPAPAQTDRARNVLRCLQEEVELVERRRRRR